MGNRAFYYWPVWGDNLMKMNFKGLVELHSLPVSNPLLPLYEAIVNSLQSIEDANIKDGRIDVKIEREAQMNLLNTWETDIESISITDNGIGFNEQNFLSFDTYASDLKIEKGCKGVGRMLWLKAFDSVEVDSTYQIDQTFYKRKFKFSAKNEVYDMKSTELKIEDNAKSLTTVILKNLRSKYKKECPKRLGTIARDVLNHCFIYFIDQNTPQIYISDDKDVVYLNKLYKDYMENNLQTSEFSIRDNRFTIVHSKNYNASTNSHLLSLCAHKRAVISNNLSAILKSINSKFISDDGQFVYSGYIFSNILDKNVNRERTDFYIPEEETDMFDDISKKEIIQTVEPMIFNYLKADIEKFNKEKFDFIADYIFTKNPRYRLLLKKYPEFINEIQWVTDEEKLEIELFKQEQAYKLILKKEGSDLAKESKKIGNLKEYLKKSTEYAEKLSEVGKSGLADYILHRKSVLDILENNLKYKDVGGKTYAYEENIHQIIFPMQNTSDDITYMEHNLWIIDEKLAYHYYLASDKNLKSMLPLACESDKEPDIIIFDSPFAFTDENKQPYRNITIIEFKRPGRESYTVSENPIQQVIEYMDDILAGSIKNKDGTYIENTENVRFFCYILCDIDKKIEKYAKQKDFKKTPDNLGYYYYMDNYNSYIEIIPYVKLIQDSKQRNQILFDKLFTQ